MSRFSVMQTPISGLKLIERKSLSDQRGFFERLFCIRELESMMNDRSIVQINRTFTAKRGVVRGLHFQHPPHAEMKMITCLQGEIFDVAVDVRKGSPTFLHWHAELLSSGNFRTLVIPEGFAHGFQTLTEECELIYLHTAPYEPGIEGGLSPLDPRLAIEWPLTISELSDRDKNHTMIDTSFLGIGV